MSKFQVTLNLDKDDELRAYVKDLIKGQIVSITREEIINTLKDLLGDKTKVIDTQKIEFIIKDVVKVHVEKELGGSSWNTGFIKDETRRMISRYIKTFFEKNSIV